MFGGEWVFLLAPIRIKFLLINLEQFELGILKKTHFPLAHFHNLIYTYSKLHMAVLGIAIYRTKRHDEFIQWIDMLCLFLLLGDFRTGELSYG